MKRILIILFMAASLFGAVAVSQPGLFNQVEGLNDKSALGVIEAAIRGDGFTTILQKPGTLQFAFFRQMNSGYGSVFVDIADSRALNGVRAGTITGNFMSGQTGDDFIRYMKQLGWQPATAGYLTAAFRTAVKIGATVRIFGNVTPLIMFTGPLTAENMPFQVRGTAQ